MTAPKLQLEFLLFSTTLLISSFSTKGAAAGLTTTAVSTEPDSSIILSVTNNGSSAIVAMILHFEQWGTNAHKTHMKTDVHYDSLLTESQRPIMPGQTYQYHYGGYGHPATGELVGVLLADGSYDGSPEALNRIKTKRSSFIAGYRDALAQYERIRSENTVSGINDLNSVITGLSNLQRQRAALATSWEEKDGVNSAYSTLIDNLRLNSAHPEHVIGVLRAHADKLDSAVSSAKMPLR